MAIRLHYNPGESEDRNEDLLVDGVRCVPFRLSWERSVAILEKSALMAVHFHQVAYVTVKNTIRYLISRGIIDLS